jgi:hypothetical protein
VPEYLLYVAYALFGLAVVACVAFVAKNFEDEEVLPERRDTER